MVQLASLERKASEYEDIYSRLEVRQVNEEAGPLLEKGEEMKTQREYKLGIFPMTTWGWSELSFLYADITSFQCWHFPPGRHCQRWQCLKIFLLATACFRLMDTAPSAPLSVTKHLHIL